MQNLSNYLMRFDARATTGTLQAELVSLAAQWGRLKLSPLEEYKVRTSEEDDSSGGTEERDEEPCHVEEPELVNAKCRTVCGSIVTFVCTLSWHSTIY